MSRKGTAGRMPEKQLGSTESGIDKAVKKTKAVFDGDNEATNYEDAKGTGQMEDAKEYSKKPPEERSRDTQPGE